jgi:ubiquinone/menaquinone biosynthesis C-methylase UbiE
MREDNIKKAVREGYANVARGQGSCCGGKSSSSCCGGESSTKTISKSIGYTERELMEAPGESNLGLGCGNPIAFASLDEGETVLDLGSGAGFDCFLAANRVGENGRVIGVDMTPEMVEKARDNARSNGYKNVEFRLGEIENLPVADNQVGVVISNCVINLVPDKARAFSEAYRTLKPGGRILVSDIVLENELPEYIKTSVSAYVGCLSGASLKEDYLEFIRNTGFQDVSVVDQSSFRLKDMLNDPTAQALISDSQLPLDKIDRDLDGSVLSIKVSAHKPIDRHFK